MAKKVLMEGLPKKIPDLEETCPIFSLPRQLKYPEVQPLMCQNFPLGSCFSLDFAVSMLKPSLYLPLLLWLYVLILHTRLDFHTEANAQLLTYSNFLSLY